MNTFQPILKAAAFAAASAVAGTAAAANNIDLVYNGLAVANASAPPATSAFANWCMGICFPTTQFPALDPSTGQKKGSADVWGRSFVYGAGGSVCFSEFIVFSLEQGEIHVNSPDKGTCGAQIDPALKPPKYPELGALVVIGGGGDGVISGGTGRYANWTGSYTDRVFVGFGLPSSGVGGIVYYDQLWFSISGK